MIHSASSVYNASVYSLRERSIRSSICSSSSSLYSKPVTVKDALIEIEKCVKRDLPPPNYVLSIDLISPELLQWNRIIPISKKKLAISNYQINIIPCLQPIELILSKADRRIRKQRIANKNAFEIQEQRIKKVKENIHRKTTKRIQRIKSKKLLHIWFKLSLIMLFVVKLKSKCLERIRCRKKLKKAIRNVILISKCLKKWRFIQISNKHASLIEVIGKHSLYLIINLRIKSRRRAVQKIIQFIVETKQNAQVMIVVKRFLYCIRRIQSLIRSFLNCKRGRVEALLNYWKKYELTFLKKRSEQSSNHSQSTKLRKLSMESIHSTNRKKSNNSTKEKQDNHDENDDQYRSPQKIKTGKKEVDSSHLSFSVQKSKWDSLEVKMKGSMSKYLDCGVLTPVKSMTKIHNQLTPEEEQRYHISLLLKEKRQEHIASKEKSIALLKQKNSKFTTADALEMLHGNHERFYNLETELNTAIKLQSKAPFFMYRGMKKAIRNCISSLHEDNKSFYLTEVF